MYSMHFMTQTWTYTGCRCRDKRVSHPRAAVWEGWSVRGLSLFISLDATTQKPHTYLDGIDPFTYPGLWAVRASHSTATLSSGGTRGLYGLRLMHRLNIFLSRSGPRAGRALFLSVHCSNPNLSEYNKCLG